MSLEHFSVTQMRNAATCPRIHYFDAQLSKQNPLSAPRLTRIWMPGTKDQVGGGAQFHTVVERFNRRAGLDIAVVQLIEQAQGEVELVQSLMRYVNQNCVDLERLASKSVPLRKALIEALHLYFEELAELINYGLSNGKDARQIAQELFGDRRRRVDVTFHFPSGDQAHVTGAIDYIYYDWRSGAHRVVDYKLTSHAHVNRDLFQVSAYALMHHHQHDTAPSVAVFYRHPERKVVDRRWDQVKAERGKIYNLLASMVQWGRYDEESGHGLKPPGDVTWCPGCKWNKKGQCERRLGPKSEGAWAEEWTELSSLRTERRSPEELAKIEQELSQQAVEDDSEDEEDEVDAELEAKAPAAASKAPSPESASTSSQRAALSDGDLLIGHQVNSRAPVTLPVEALKTHVAVVGAAGSGKTWTAKVLAEEAAASGVPVLAIDPQGDLVQFLVGRSSDEFADDAQRRLQAEFLDKVEPRVFTPGTSHGTRLSLSPLRLPNADDLAHIGKPERRREEEETMLQAAAANLVSLAAVGGEEDSQRTFLYLLFQNMDRRASVELRDVVQAIRHPDNLGLEDVDSIIKKTEREKLGRKLQAFVMGPAKNLFSGGVPLDLDAMRRASSPDKTPLNVIYLNALTDDDQKQFFLASLASELYRWMVSSLDATGSKPNLLFYIDEARDWIPAGTKSSPAKQPLIRLFTQGRKYGVGCLLCTQSPRSVDYNVFGNCSTKIVGRLEASQDVERIMDWFTVTGAAPRWIAARKGASKGTFVGRWPAMPSDLEGQPFKGRVLYSTHEGAWSPDRVEAAMDRLGSR